MERYKSSLEIENNLFGKKGHGLASHLCDGDVVEVDGELVAVEGQASLAGEGSQLHKAAAAKPRRDVTGWIVEFLEIIDKDILRWEMRRRQSGSRSTSACASRCLG